jgi:hypothetical protein
VATLRLVVESDDLVEAARLLLEAMYCGDGAAALDGAPQPRLLQARRVAPRAARRAERRRGPRRRAPARALLVAFLIPSLKPTITSPPTQQTKPSPQQVLQLADRFGAPRAAAAAARLLASTPPPAADWSAVCGALGLPAALREAPAFSEAMAWARAAVRAELGDLEAALCRPEARRRLAALPLEGALGLLRDDATRAASENTAYGEGARRRGAAEAVRRAEAPPAAASGV